MSTLRLLEELSLNALPPLQSLHYDGWELRFSSGANGYPRRANSIQMLYPSMLPLEEKVAHCEALYRARGQRTVFKMTLAAPDGLDALLRARGYVFDAPTSVRTLDLERFDAQPEAGIEVQIETEMSGSWYADFARLNENDPLRAATTRQLLERLAIPSAFVRLCRDGETVALGRGALEHGWIGFYEIVTDERYRQQGLGRQLMLNILKWGKDNGARNAYLQVMTENTPAVRLYSSLGFTMQYEYWYLQKQP
jgi:ribosomal protein S18 acetylase RimI-like enzyme